MFKGGPGSGNFGHEGRPGQRGGSGSGGGESSNEIDTGDGGGNVDPNGGYNGYYQLKQNDITKEEGNSVASYARNGYEPINNYLRKGIYHSEGLEESIKNLDSAIEKQPKGNWEVSRGVKNDFQKMLEKKAKSIGAKTEQEIEEKLIGMTYKDKGFCSTTSDDSIAERFRGYDGTGMIVTMKLKNQKGLAVDRHVDSNNQQGNEFEIIFKRNLKFKITKAKYVTNKYDKRELQIEVESV